MVIAGLAAPPPGLLSVSVKGVCYDGVFKYTKTSRHWAPFLPFVRADEMSTEGNLLPACCVADPATVAQLTGLLLGQKLLLDEWEREGARGSANERRWDAERRSLDAEIRELEELLTSKRSEYQACLRKQRTTIAELRDRNALMIQLKDQEVHVAGHLVLQMLVEKDAALAVAAKLRVLYDQQRRRLIAMELKEADTAHTNERLTVEFAFGNALRQLRE